MGYWILGGLGLSLFIYVMFLKNKEVWANIGEGKIQEQAKQAVQTAQAKQGFCVGKNFHHTTSEIQFFLTDNGVLSIMGEIENESDKNYALVCWDVSVHDTQGNLLGVTFMGINNLMARQIRAYDTTMTISPDTTVNTIGSITIQLHSASKI